MSSPASPALPPPTLADRAAFETELLQVNLRNTLWFSVVGNIFIWGVTLLIIFHPIPLSAEAHYFDGLLCATGLTNAALIVWLRRRPVAVRGLRVLVPTNAALYLGLTNAYFFAMIPAYGNTSVYIVGVLSLVIFFRLSLPLLATLLLVNHAVFLFLLFQQPMPAAILLSCAVDYSGMVVLAGVAGWLLYRAQWENFRKERVIVERNRELARLHQLELTEKLAAQLAEEKARLEVLRYQLNPHFLFNALTSICSQLPPTLPGARATIERLTDFCQLTLFKPDDGTHPTVEAELNLLRAYLDIEKSRWGDLLTVEIELAPAVVTERIPSLLLLPLLENALKYGRATNRGAMTVRVTAHRDASSALVIAIANTGEWVSSPGAASIPSLGIGLENLRQRLQRYYPGAHDFTTEARDGWVVARLAIRDTGQPALSSPHA